MTQPPDKQFRIAPLRGVIRRRDATHQRATISNANVNECRRSMDAQNGSRILSSPSLCAMRFGVSCCVISRSGAVRWSGVVARDKTRRDNTRWDGTSQHIALHMTRHDIPYYETRHHHNTTPDHTTPHHTRRHEITPPHRTRHEMGYHTTPHTT